MIKITREEVSNGGTGEKRFCRFYFIQIILIAAISIFQGKAMTSKTTVDFPALMGLYSIGTTTRYLIDYERKETHNLSANRELMITLWYPSENNEKNQLRAYDQITSATKDLLIKLGYPEQEINELGNLYVHAIQDALPLNKNGKYPVIIFSHGYIGSLPNMYTAICEELASHGFIVVGVAHTYYVASVAFPDGKQIVAPTEKYAQMKERLYNPEDLEIWEQDSKFVLDQVAKFNRDPNDGFFNLIDLNRVGMLGHSFGGATAFQVCLRDSRLKAGVSLDGVLFGDKTKITDLTKPFLFILAQDSIETFKESDEVLAKKYSASVEVIKESRKEFDKVYPQPPTSNILPHLIIPGIKHGGFTDLLIIKELPFIKKNKHIFDLDLITGSADGYKTIELINQHIVNFFDKYVR